MYIPLDPNKVSNFWEKFIQDLLTNKSSYLIIDGKKILTLKKCLLILILLIN
jgi:hypothetical protein